MYKQFRGSDHQEGRRQYQETHKDRNNKMLKDLWTADSARKINKTRFKFRHCMPSKRDQGHQRFMDQEYKENCLKGQKQLYKNQVRQNRRL